MTYSLKFKPKALKEWNKLNSTIKKEFAKKLETILENPHISHNKLSGFNSSQSSCFGMHTLSYKLQSALQSWSFVTRLRSLPIINEENKDIFIKILKYRFDELEKDAQKKRIEKVLKSIGAK